MTTVLLAILVGVLFLAGTYLILRRGEIKLILGLALLSHGVNLLLFGTGGLRRGTLPILDKGQAITMADLVNYPDPLPQALILTAIVISFGITAFVIVLVNRRITLEYGVEGQIPATIPEADTDGDGFAYTPDYYTYGLDPSEDDYEYLEYHPIDDYLREKANRQQRMATQKAQSSQHGADPLPEEDQQ